MSVDTIVTFGRDRRYYLVFETIQDNKIYFLGNKLNIEYLPTTESYLFEEFKDD